MQVEAIMPSLNQNTKEWKISAEFLMLGHLAARNYFTVRPVFHHPMNPLSRELLENSWPSQGVLREGGLRRP